MATFGFSVGDFVACLSLIREVAQALNDSKGSAAEYQSLFQTLVSLNQALAASESIYFLWSNQAASPAYKKNTTEMINGIAFEQQKCRQLLEAFLKSSQPYTDSSVIRGRGSVVRNWRKVTWLFQKEQVEKLERDLQRHLQALRIYSDAFFQNQTINNIEIMGSKLGSILSNVVDLRTDVSTVIKALQVWGTPKGRSLGYPWEASACLTENVLLLDAIGRTILLPMLLLSSPRIFHDILQIMYRGIPGHRRIVRGDYNVTDEDADGILIKESNWNDIIRLGMRITLNIVLQASSSWNVHHCPRCNQATFGHYLKGERRRCQKCQLTFRVFDRERIVEKSDVRALFETADTADTNGDESHVEVAANALNPTFKSKSKKELENQEAYIFQTIHYQRDVKKIRIKKQVEGPSEDECRKLEIDELTPLHQAAAKGIISEITTLLDAGENIDSPLPFKVVTVKGDHELLFEGCSPLHIASWFGKTKAINLLLDRGANIEVQDVFKATVLEYAITGNDPGVAIALITRGADKKCVNSLNRTLIHTAAAHEHTWLIHLLLSHGLDVDSRTIYGATPLHYACYHGHEAVAKVLIEKGAIVAAQDHSRNTPLHYACYHGHEAVVKILIEQGANIAAQDNNGETPLFDACYLGHDKAVQTMLELGADISAQNHDKLTPLHCACQENHSSVVRILLERGSDWKAQNRFGSMPIHFACKYGSEQALKVLLEQNLDSVTSQDNIGDTPLHLACCWGYESIVKVLTDSKCNTNIVNSSGDAPLHEAAYNGSAEIVRLLVQYGSDPSARRKDGSTALWLAAERGHLAAAEVLIETGRANLSARHDDGRTALHAATMAQAEEVVSLLLSHGCDRNIQDCYGDTASDIAVRNENPNLVALLDVDPKST